MPTRESALSPLQRESALSPLQRVREKHLCPYENEREEGAPIDVEPIGLFFFQKKRKTLNLDALPAALPPSPFFRHRDEPSQSPLEMVHYVLSGTDVDFPHAAYGTQLVLMGKVIAAADQGRHALLEAPTGSGKTAALLC